MPWHLSDFLSIRNLSHSAAFFRILTRYSKHKTVENGTRSSQAWAKLTKNPEDRTEPVRKVLEGLGGKLVALFPAFGEYEVVALVEMPDNMSAAAFSIAGAAGGAVKNVKTTPLMTTEDGIAAMRKAAEAGYRPPTETRRARARESHRRSQYVFLAELARDQSGIWAPPHRGPSRVRADAAESFIESRPSDVEKPRFNITLATLLQEHIGTRWKIDRQEARGRVPIAAT